jgi:hypothetical protein
MASKLTRKEITEKRLYDALDRLIANQPISSVVKKKKGYKINPYNVQLEADVSIGSIRHHPDVVNAIQAHRTGEPCGGLNTELTLLRNEILKLKDAKKKLKTKLDKSVELQLKYRQELAELRTSHLHLVANQHELLTGLLKLVPREKRELLMRTYDSKINIVSFPNRTE